MHVHPDWAEFTLKFLDESHDVHNDNDVQFVQPYIFYPHVKHYVF